VHAIGVFLEDSLPGLYWLNYFGPPYTKLFGKERLLSAPGFEVGEADGGVLVALDEVPMTWTGGEYRAREAAVIDHLGREFFFSKDTPERKTVAPEFRRQ
jgi:hypothetical protein